MLIKSRTTAQQFFRSTTTLERRVRSIISRLRERRPFRYVNEVWRGAFIPLSAEAGQSIRPGWASLSASIWRCLLIANPQPPSRSWMTDRPTDRRFESDVVDGDCSSTSTAPGCDGQCGPLAVVQVRAVVAGGGRVEEVESSTCDAFLN